MPSSDQDDPGRSGRRRGRGRSRQDAGFDDFWARESIGPSGRSRRRRGADDGGRPPAMSATSPATARVARRRSPGRSARTQHEAAPTRGGASRGPGAAGRPTRRRRPRRRSPTPAAAATAWGRRRVACPTGSRPCPAVDAGPDRRRATRWGPRLRSNDAGPSSREPRPRGRCPASSSPVAREPDTGGYPARRGPDTGGYPARRGPDTGAIPPAATPTPAATPRCQRRRHRRLPRAPRPRPARLPASPRGRPDGLGRPWRRRRAVSAPLAGRRRLRRRRLR